MNRPVTDLVNSRFSCRIYRNEPIASDIRREFEERLSGFTVGPFGSPVRLLLVAASAEDPRTLKGLGTYGFIKGATGFLVGAVNRGPLDLEDYGHVVEQAVLAAADLGLGTCWLGGSFTKSTFAKRLGGLASNEIMPAVVSVGYPGEDGGARIKEREIGSRRLPGTSLFFEDGFGTPLGRVIPPGFAEALEAVRMAPSASNKQPWRIVHRDQDWHFYLQRTKGYGKGSALFSVLRLADLQRVDMGIAMSHFALVAGAAGLEGRWVVDEPHLAALGEGVEYTATWRQSAGADT